MLMLGFLIDSVNISIRDFTGNRFPLARAAWYDQTAAFDEHTHGSSTRYCGTDPGALHRARLHLLDGDRSLSRSHLHRASAGADAAGLRLDQHAVGPGADGVHACLRPLRDPDRTAR